jgi:hypothetical protein
MTLTARAAAEMISVSHHLGLRDAGRVLAAGLAGAPKQQGRALLYDEDEVDRLIMRPQCPLDDLDRWRPFVMRIGRTERFDALAPWDEQVQTVRGPWRLPIATSIALTDILPPELPDVSNREDWSSLAPDSKADPWPARTARGEAQAAYITYTAAEDSPLSTIPVRSNGRL